MSSSASSLALAAVFLAAVLVCGLEIGRSTVRTRPRLGYLLDVRDRDPEWPLLIVATALLGIAFAGALMPWLLLLAVPVLAGLGAYLYLSGDHDRAVVVPLPAHHDPVSNMRVVERLEA